VAAWFLLHSTPSCSALILWNVSGGQSFTRPDSSKLAK
jgi:hypothetical protein